ncbi:universal stress protein [Halosimplex pelagicum]|uniref:Universal stress protein n=1 Tax=Halosimplex pelagicum TaxID=869886 RepID=A0A7D5PC03_9EURY|nr:universal stress protein [Halosimplex pelagicum]QLH82098.1 universal stress protein [Halosimplex pelagicum]
MYDNILIPTDGSDGATVAFNHALDIATTHDATIHILNVADTTRDSITQIRGDVVDTLETEGDEIVLDAADRAQQRGLTTKTDVLQGEPYSTIVDYAEARDVGLIVMPTHGRRGLERFLLGSTTERVVRRADTPVLTIRPDEDITVTYPYQDILLPTDGSDCATDALTTGIDVATAEKATLQLLSVVNMTSLGADVLIQMQMEALEESANTIIEEATDHAETEGVDSVSGSVEFGSSIHRAILSHIEEHDVDLVVVGTHGRTGFDRYVLGSVTEKLVRTSPVPVLTVRSSQ